MFAAASLKLRSIAIPTRYALITFRGMFAAASLKPLIGEETRGAHDDFPRHVCRGLIEAMARPIRARSAATLSAACLPRPH